MESPVASNRRNSYSRFLTLKQAVQYFSSRSRTTVYLPDSRRRIRDLAFFNFGYVCSRARTRIKLTIKDRGFTETGLCLPFFNDLQCQRPSVVLKDISDDLDLQEVYNRTQTQLFFCLLQLLPYQGPSEVGTSKSMQTQKVYSSDEVLHCFF